LLPEPRYTFEFLSLNVLLSCRETPYTLSIPLAITEFLLVVPGKKELE